VVLLERVSRSTNSGSIASTPIRSDGPSCMAKGFA
jgi:hypothetical protein